MSQIKLHSRVMRRVIINRITTIYTGTVRSVFLDSESRAYIVVEFDNPEHRVDKLQIYHPSQVELISNG